MSFGFGVGDFLAVLKIAKNVYGACVDGPVEYKEICSETKSLKYALLSLSYDARDPDSLLNQKGTERKSELEEILTNCRKSLEELQALVERHSSLGNDGKGQVIRIWDAYQVGSSNLESLRGRLTFHTSTISMFLLSLESSAIARMETKLDKIYARMLRDDAYQARQSSSSVASTTSILSQIETHEDDVWAVLKAELLDENFSRAQIMANKDNIISYIKTLLSNGMPNGAAGVAATDIYRNGSDPLEAHVGPSTINKADRKLSPAGTKNPIDALKGWVNPASSLEVVGSLRKLRYGYINEMPACMILVDLDFTLPKKHTLVADQIHMGFTHSDGAVEARPQILAVRTKCVRGQPVKQNPGTDASHPQIVWNMTADSHRWRHPLEMNWPLSKRMRFGILMLYHNKPFYGKFVVEAMDKSRLGVPSPSSIHKNTIDLYLAPIREPPDEILTPDALDEFVNEMSIRYPL